MMSAETIHIDLQQWVNGDDVKFATIYNHYRPKVYKYALRYLKSHRGADEIASEVMIKVWQKRQQIDLRRFENYLFTIARNLLITEWRKTIKHVITPDSLEHLSSGDPNYSSHEELEAIYQKTLLNLPPQRRKIFVMHREHQLTYKEISIKLNISPKTVENQIGATIKQLRIQLDHLFYSIF